MPEAGAFSPRHETRTAKHAKKLSQFPLAAPSCFRQGIGSYTVLAERLASGQRNGPSNAHALEGGKLRKLVNPEHLSLRK